MNKPVKFEYKLRPIRPDTDVELRLLIKKIYDFGFSYMPGALVRRNPSFARQALSRAERMDLDGENRNRIKVALLTWLKYQTFDDPEDYIDPDDQETNAARIIREIRGY